MLSPVPLNINDYGGLPSSPGPVAGSPFKWSFQSPGLGRTPGAYVVQEGRLSLEVFDLGEAHLESPKVNPSIDLLTQIDAAKVAPAALQRASSIAQLDLFAPNNQNLAHKTDKKTSLNATTEMADAKAVLQSKMLNALPEKLNQQMKHTIAHAKASVGLDHFDSSDIENRLQATLQHPTTAYTHPQAPRSTTHHPSITTDAHQYQQNDQQHLNARPRRKRARPSYLDELADDDIDEEMNGNTDNRDNKESIMPPSKRLATINKLSQELRDIENRNRQLYSILTQTEDKLQSETTDNNTLWAMIAHIGAAVHAAVEERKAEAASLANALAFMQQEYTGGDNNNDNNNNESGDNSHESGSDDDEDDDDTTNNNNNTDGGNTTTTITNNNNSGNDTNANTIVENTVDVTAMHQRQQQQLLQLQQQQQQQMTALKPSSAMRHTYAFTPTVPGQQLFSPSSDDLFAACGMFSSPMLFFNSVVTTVREPQMDGSENVEEKRKELKE